MNGSKEYIEIARAYADGVRVLLAPSGKEAGERGGRGPQSFGDLTDQAHALSIISGRLTNEASLRLSDPEPTVRSATDTSMLAKALTDLEIGGYLLEAARDEEVQATFSDPRTAERSFSAIPNIEDQLAILLGEAIPKPDDDRSTTTLRNLPAAQFQLLEQSTDTLALITARVHETGKTALEGLSVLGAGELVKAVGIIGVNIADAIGQAEKVTRLYELFRKFLCNAYDSILALLGPQLAKTIGEQVKNWVEKFKANEPLGGIIEKIYATGQTRDELKQLITTSDAGLLKFSDALQQVELLSDTFQLKTRLACKIVSKLRWIAVIPIAALPSGKLLVAAAYIALTGYVVLVGADFVDAKNLQILKRVDGVKRVVERSLN